MFLHFIWKAERQERGLPSTGPLTRCLQRSGRGRAKSSPELRSSGRPCGWQRPSYLGQGTVRHPVQATALPGLTSLLHQPPVTKLLVQGSLYLKHSFILECVLVLTPLCQTKRKVRDKLKDAQVCNRCFKLKVPLFRPKLFTVNFCIPSRGNKIKGE